MAQFILQRKGVLATGRPTATSGWKVLAGSTAIKESSARVRRDHEFRNQLIAERVLVQHGGNSRLFEFTRDFEFSSASRAAGVILDGNASGPAMWIHDGTGVSYREWLATSADAGDLTSEETLRKTGNPFRASAQERTAIELHSMDVAKQYLEGLGYSTVDTSRTEPFDFIATRLGNSIIVEVKGTTSRGQQVILTEGERKAQAEAYPDNALIVVHSIEIDTRCNDVFCTGGEVHCLLNWRIEPCQLQPIQYRYSVPGL